MLTHLTSFAALLPLIAPVARETQDGPAPAVAELKPVTVCVVDRKSGAPVTEFTYQARYEAPGHENQPWNNIWTRVASPTGTFELKTPLSCQLTILANAPDYIGGYPLANEFVIKSADNPRRVVVRLRKGITVRGTVRDARTRQPIAGASVAPVILKLPIWAADRDKLVKTSPDGRYEVRGVDPELGISATHADYVHDPAFPDGDTICPNHDVYLKRAPTIALKFTDSSGKPLEGVTVADGFGVQPVSGHDGKLVLQAPRTFEEVKFHKNGFIDREFSGEQIRRDSSRPEALVVVMTSSWALTGRVLGPDGRPVRDFTLAAGRGELPDKWDTVQRRFRGPEGRFELNLSWEDATWVGVAAPGLAAWEGHIEFKRGFGPLEVRLSPGVAVSATVVVPAALSSRVKASLVPRRDKSSIGGLSTDTLAEGLPTRTGTLAENGTLRFDHVRPDRYRLIIDAPGKSNSVFALDVPEAATDGGTVSIDLPAAAGRPTGRIEGRVWHPKDKGGHPWAFAKGYIEDFRSENGGDDDEPSIKFQTDETGRFKVEGVPVGLKSVGIIYQFFDVVSSYNWCAAVVEGKTTMVHAFEPDGKREVALKFVIGDGSNPQYESGTGRGAARKVDNVTGPTELFAEVGENDGPKRNPIFRPELIPVSNDPLAFAQPIWAALGEHGTVILPDVGPGTYRLLVYDWLGSWRLKSGPLVDREIRVDRETRGEVRIALGAGCMTGKAPVAKDDFRRSVEVTAVAKGGRTPSRKTRCDHHGNFCVRYLTPGTYSLFINDPGSGYCRIDDVKVPAGVIDVGERKLLPGAKVRAEIRFPRLSRVPDKVMAIGPAGVAISRELPIYSSVDRAELAGLWPGLWTVSARSGNEIVASSDLAVEGTGTYEVTLTVGGERRP